MAETTETEALSTGDEVIPRIKLGETGFNALRVSSGVIFEECQWELRWPHAINTFKKMSKDGTIAPALNLVEMMIARVPWEVKIPEGYEEELKDKADFLRQNMNDMEESWGSFIKEVVSFNRYGFSVHEKVYRKRLRVNGSKYNDGLIGLKKLPIRSQDSIIGWEWENQGRDLSGVWQQTVKPTGLEQPVYQPESSIYGEKVKIPRKKFLLFRTGNTKDDPNGQSPLVGCWESWKYKKALEETEAVGISQDMQGFKVLYLPPRYLDPNATEEDKAVYSYYQRMMRNAQVAEQSGFILPQVLDENGNKFFDFQIVSVTGQKAFDTSAIIQRYAQEILTCLFADFLSLGSNGSGSFSLAESKVSVVEMAIESKLLEIQDQLNHDLVKQLFQLNGWDTSITPYFCFGKIAKQDLDVLSKFIQRVASVGMMGKTKDNVNWIAEQAGMPTKFTEDDDDFLEQLTGYESGAAEGMTTPGEGTSKSPVGGDDSSVGNNENANIERVRFDIISKDDEFVTVKFGNMITKFSLEDWAELDTE